MDLFWDFANIYSSLYLKLILIFQQSLNKTFLCYLSVESTGLKCYDAQTSSYLYGQNRSTVLLLHHGILFLAALCRNTLFYKVLIAQLCLRTVLGFHSKENFSKRLIKIAPELNYIPQPLEIMDKLPPVLFEGERGVEH